MGRGVVIAGVALVVGVAACRGGDRPPPVYAWSADLQALDRSIEQLEERLLVDQARVAFWSEMKDRHHDVTAIACENLAQHAASSAALAQTKLDSRFGGSGTSRIATRFTPSAEGRHRR